MTEWNGSFVNWPLFWTRRLPEGIVIVHHVLKTPHIIGPMLPNDELRLVRSLRVDHMWHFDNLPFSIPPHLQNIISGLPMHSFPRFQTNLSRAKIMASAWSGRLPNFSTNRQLSLQSPPCGSGYGNCRAQRNCKYSIGSLCRIGYLPNNTCYFLGLRLVLTALGVTIRKPLSMCFATIHGLRMFGSVHQGYCLLNSFPYLSKNG